MKNNYKILLFGAFPILLFFTVKVVGKSFRNDKVEIQLAPPIEKFETNRSEKPVQNTPFILTKHLQR